MITERSNHYFRFPNEIKDRIDFVYNHLYFDYLENMRTKSNCVDLSKKTDKGPDFSEMFEFFNSGVDFEGVYYVPEGVIYYRAGDINDENFLELNDGTKRVPNDYVTEESTFLEKNDVLIVKDGATTGKVGYVKQGVPEGLFNTHLFRIKCRETKVKPKYLFYFLSSKIGQDQIAKNISGSAQGGITLNAISDLFVIIPDSQDDIIKAIEPLEKQALDLRSESKKFLTRANSILLDELEIDLQDEEIRYFFKEGKQKNSDCYFKFNEQIEGRLHYLFHHPKLQILDKLESKYQTIQLRHICREPIKRGEQPKYSDFGIMVIKTVDLKNRFVDYENTSRVSEGFYLSKPQAHIKKNDILVSSTGYVSVGKIDIFELEERAFADGHVSIVRVNEDYDPHFVTYFLRSPLGQIQFEKWFTGSSGQIEVQPEDLSRFILPTKEAVPKSRQNEIADRITAGYLRARDYEQKCQSTWKKARDLFEKLILRN